MKKRKTFGLYGKNSKKTGKKTEKFSDTYYEEWEEYAEEEYTQEEEYEPDGEDDGYRIAYQDEEFHTERMPSVKEDAFQENVEGDFETEEIVVQEYEVDELDREDIDLQQFVADGYKEVEETLHGYTEELYTDEDNLHTSGAFPTEKIVVPQFIQQGYADEAAEYDDIDEIEEAYSSLENTQELEYEEDKYQTLEYETKDYEAEDYVEQRLIAEDYEAEENAQQDYEAEGYAEQDYEAENYVERGNEAYEAEDYTEPDYEAEEYAEQDYEAEEYAKQDYEHENYAEHGNEADAYEAEDYTEQDYEAEDYAEQDYEAEDYIEKHLTAQHYPEEDFDSEDEEESEDSFDTAYGDVDNHYDNDIASFGANLQQKGKNAVEWIKDTVTHMTAFDAIVACTGVVLVVAAIVILNMFLGSKRLDGQIEAMAPVGEDLTNIGIVGEDGLLAMADAMLSGTLETMTETDTEEESSSEENVPETSRVNVSFVSVEKDLKIRFTDADTGALITGTAFEVILTNAKGKELRLVDEDMDGIIYATDVNPGVFEAVVVSTDKYKFPTASQQVTVKKKVEFAVINVQDEVKKESQVNVAVEDTEKQDAIKEEVKLTDTVEWVESTKTLISGSEGYLPVDKNTIADPSKAARADARKLFDTLNVTLDQTSLSLAIGGSAQLKGSEFTDSTEGDIAYKYTTEWKSSNEGVATVSNGTVTAKASGTATITYTVTKTTITTTYEPKEPTEEVLDISLDEYEGLSDEEKQKCTPVKDDADQTIGYTYRKTIQPEKKTSETTETASASCEVTVEAAKISSASLELTTSADNCDIGETLTVSPLKLVYTKEDGSKETISEGFPAITWASADKAIATVDEKGVVTGVKAGKVSITASIAGIQGADGKDLEIKAAIEITVNETEKESETETETEQPVLSITLDRTKEVYIEVGKNTTLVATVKNYKEDSGVTWTTSDKKIATVDEKGVVTGVAAGKVTITAVTKEKGEDDKPAKAECVVTVNSSASTDMTSKLKDKNGNQMYIKDNEGNYKEAVFADYFTAQEFYIKTEGQYRYTGWQTINGKTYYYDKNGTPVTGTQIIQGVTYNFGADGAIATTVNGSKFGIDISRHNGNIDWNAVKASGVDYVIIRCGYRGSATGVLIEDENFKKNIRNATAAGLKVGIYVFSQAINEVEAVKEASLAVSLAKGYNLTYPIFIDTESSGGRADKIDVATRTAVVNAFCQTVASAGYQPGIYASKSWFETKLNMGAIGNYKIWLAQYSAAPTYKGRYDMWQYTSKGKISGIKGNVDLNYSYLGY
ncbi:MAG: hypothetical protein HFJ08_09165 [Lachnospiraceae bacterium]|nr:hypothetical protein [Lachnospiraceae bacterium]